MKNTLLYACKEENVEQLDNVKPEENTASGSEQFSSVMEEPEMQKSRTFPMKPSP